VRFFFGVFEDLTEFDMVGFSKYCFERMGGNKREYAHCHINLHVVRRWQYYAWKIAMPVLICTVFSFASFFYPIEAEPIDGVFSASIAVDALDMRNQIAATMILASSALLFVVATLLPKTSYLTTIDRFVLGNLGIQSAVAMVTWVSCGIFFEVSDDLARRINQVSCVALLVAVWATYHFTLGRAIARTNAHDPREWPDTLPPKARHSIAQHSRAEHSTAIA
jgi:hypothetical protein